MASRLLVVGMCHGATVACGALAGDRGHAEAVSTAGSGPEALPAAEVLPEPRACAGPSGAFASLDSRFERLVIGSVSLFFFSRGERESEEVWQVDKLTAERRPLAAGEVSPAEGAVVSQREGGETYAVGADEYFDSEGALIRRRSGAEQRLFDLPDVGDQAHTFVVMGSDFYATSSNGALWHARLAPEVTPPVIVEQRGRYDDDDYSPLLGVDADSVYWQAGDDPTRRLGDGDVLTLFRTCRSAIDP